MSPKPRHPRRLLAVLLVVLVAILLAAPVAGARDAGDASAAASFVENAQNPDGGFGAEPHQGSNPQASLWATVALLAAGKNPQGEMLNNGTSADAYLAAHLAALGSLQDLGLLAIVQAAAGVVPARYGDPAAQLRRELTSSVMQHDPSGAAIGILGLLAVGSSANRSTATAAARALLSSPDRDGGWGSPLSTSTATALVLQAVGVSRAAGTSDASVNAAIAYLKRAQVNDGSIATSDRTDPSSTGNVAATAFTVQALQVVRAPTLRTATGTTVLQGLASYQQHGTGGLSQFGAYDTGVAASVLQTAQAYPAFDGVAFPLPAVPYTATAKAPSITPTPSPRAANRSSAGSSTQGISSSTASGHRRVAAYQGASAAGSTKAKAGRGAPATGTSVTGSVLGATQAPKLTTRAGRAPATDLTGPLLGVGLLLLALLGAYLDSRRPRRDPRSAAARAVQAGHDRWRWLRLRGSLAALSVLPVAVALIVLPLATSMWSRAPQGAQMITAFAPYMRDGELDRLQHDVGLLDGGVKDAQGPGARLQFPSVSRRALAVRFATVDPQLAHFARQWPGIDRRFESLLDPMQANRGNFAAIAALPSFDLFPWAFAGVGALLVVLVLLALVVPGWWHRLRWGVLGVGVALVIAPIALGLLSRAPKGARLVSAFATVETRSKVTAAQNDFASLAVGESTFETELLPALARNGIDARQVAHELPGVTALDDHFIAILGDLTPVLGVMSDNVARYDAVAALPSFDLFPWLFAVPGLLLSGCILLPAARRRRLRSEIATQLTSHDPTRDSQEDHVHA